LLFLAYRKPSLFGPSLSYELISRYLTKGMKAQVQWILNRRDKQQKLNKDAFLEIFVRTKHLDLVKELVEQYAPFKNKPLLLRLIKHTDSDTYEGITIREILQKELEKF